MMKRHTEFCVNFLLIFLFCNLVYCDIEEKRLCADPLCKNAISTGKTKQKYSPHSPGLLHFGINQNVQVLSKEKGFWKDYWYIEVTGRRGYVKSTFIKEDKILVKQENLIVVDSDVQELSKFSKPPNLASSIVQPPTQSTEGVTAPLPTNNNPVDIVINEKADLDSKEESVEISPTNKLDDNIKTELKKEEKDEELEVESEEYDDEDSDNEESNELSDEISEEEEDISNNNQVKPSIGANHILDNVKNEEIADLKSLHTENTFLNTAYSTNAPSLPQDSSSNSDILSAEIANEPKTEAIPEKPKENYSPTLQTEPATIVQAGEHSSNHNTENLDNPNNDVTSKSSNNYDSIDNNNNTTPITNTVADGSTLDPSTESLSVSSTETEATLETVFNTTYSTDATSLLQDSSTNSDMLSAQIVNEPKTEVITEIRKEDYSKTVVQTAPSTIVQTDEQSSSQSAVNVDIPNDDVKTDEHSTNHTKVNVDNPINDVTSESLPKEDYSKTVVQTAPSTIVQTDEQSSSQSAVNVDIPNDDVKTDEHSINHTTVNVDNPINDVASESLNNYPSTDNNSTTDTTTSTNTVADDTTLSSSLTEEALKGNHNLELQANEQKEQQLQKEPQSENVNIENNDIHIESLPNNINNSTFALETNSSSTSENSLNDYTNKVSNDVTSGFISDVGTLPSANPITNENHIHYPAVERKATTPDPGQDNVYYNSVDDGYSVSTTPTPSYSQQTNDYPSLNNNRLEETVASMEATTEHNFHPTTDEQDPSNTETAQQDLTTQNTHDQVSEPEITYNPFYDVDTQEEAPSFFTSLLESVSNFWNKLRDDQEEPAVNNFQETTETVFNPVQESPDQAQVDDGYCEHLTPNECPKSMKSSSASDNVADDIKYNNEPSTNKCLNYNEFFEIITNKIIEMFDIILSLSIVAVTVLIFVLGHYWISHSRKENTLISKLNIVERSLLASNKEANILKHDLIQTRNKLVSIEDNSFGSNDMVVALKKELEVSALSKIETEEKIAVLEKELENAAEAGLELNKIVSELLNNQSGDDSIISSVEELQKQLNEQQNTILQINTTLAEKSRENSELQMLIADQEVKLVEEVKSLRELNEKHQEEEDKLRTELEESKNALHKKISEISIKKDSEIGGLTKKLTTLTDNYNDVYKKWQVSDSRVEALEECLSNMKKDPKVNIKDFMNVANLKADVLAVKRERDSFKERLEGEMDARKLLEDHVKIVSEEVSSLKQEYTQSEKEKVEAQTRLDVLSSYFKEKETQLQKELSVKEAMSLKQQGETTSTVERVRIMQDEIQSLKSQNDSFRAEIEAQSAAHKAQLTNLENRAHDTWIAARQSERKLEESRSEATALRRKLTSIVNHSTNDTSLQNRITNSVDGLQADFNGAPSPIHMDSPGSPLLGGLPPPPPFIPPPFMGHPFMGMPPPFMSPGEMRPPPLGRLMSPPPPPPDRYSPSIVDERDRYSPENGRYSPDSRYNYNTDIMSTYDTETDLSPPPSPHLRSGGGGSNVYNSREREHRSRGYKAYSPPPKSDRSKKSKGVPSSGSAESFDSRKGKGKGKV